MLQEAYVIPLREILAGIKSAMEGDFPTLPSLDEVLYSASLFKNVKLVNSLLAAGAHSLSLDPSYVKSTSKPKPGPKPKPKPGPPPLSTRQDQMWYCSHCSPNGPMTISMNDYCSSCGHKREAFSK